MRYNLVIDGKEQGKSGNAPGDLTLVLTTNNQIYMEMVKDALEGEGIPALIKSVTGYHGRGMLPFGQQFFDYRLFVSKEHKERALEIVDTIVPPKELQ
jgi:hypothetical protein